MIIYMSLEMLTDESYTFYSFSWEKCCIGGSAFTVVYIYIAPQLWESFLVSKKVDHILETNSPRWNFYGFETTCNMGVNKFTKKNWNIQIWLLTFLIEHFNYLKKKNQNTSTFQTSDCYDINKRVTSIIRNVKD